jgi:hypothetical protein
VWNTEVFPPGRTLLEQIEILPSQFDTAVLLATPDVACRIGSRRFRTTVANVFFEYGYLSARLTRERVAICQFQNADLPSDLRGVKLIDGGDTKAGDKALPGAMVRQLEGWLAGAYPLAEGVSPTTLLHGYSGRWNIQNHFEIWQDIPIKKPDRVWFDGVATLSIPPDGQHGSGMMYGQTHIFLADYRADLEVVNEVLDASVNRAGQLALRIEVVRRRFTRKHGTPPQKGFRNELPNKEFTVTLTPAPGELHILRGPHMYHQANRPYSMAAERYEKIH